MILTKEMSVEVMLEPSQEKNVRAMNQDMIERSKHDVAKWLP